MVDTRNQIVITRFQGRLLLLFMKKDKIYDILVGEEKQPAGVGDIYVGRIQNIVKNINAAFVEFSRDEGADGRVTGYLPLPEVPEGQRRCGGELVVQVKKAAVKTKQPVLTAFPEIAGRTCVITTKNKNKAISKKILDQSRLEQLKLLLGEFEDEEYGIVLRTNAETAGDAEILAECRSLCGELRRILDEGRYRAGFSLLRKEMPFYEKYIVSCREGEIDRIVTDIPELHDGLRARFGEIVELYEDASYPLDLLYGISHQIQKALEKRVWLKSGGNLVIEPTEALTVIDVNTGKAVEGKRNKETTFFKINCEAAAEAARQIRIRNLSGIIVVDFIDMKEKEHRKKLMEPFERELKEDRTRTALVDITKLGLVEVTRMKVNRPLSEVLQIKEELIR